MIKLKLKPMNIFFEIRVTCMKTTNSILLIPVKGGYSQWSVWSPCSMACDGGSKRRFRSCTNPPPAHGGWDCRKLGRATESRRCNTHKCPGKDFVLVLSFNGAQYQVITKHDPVSLVGVHPSPPPCREGCVQRS